MAKQNFVAGGFYGKLGEMVGQRWKNKRTLRVYVIPHDPRTPSQVAQRNTFAAGVPYAQIGLRFNKGAPCWQSEGRTEWMMRMGTAVNRVKSGVQGDLVIPLWPDGYTPHCSAESVSFVSLAGGRWRIDFLPSNPVTVGRKMMLSLECGREGSIQTETVVLMGDVTNADSGGVVVDLGGYYPVDGGRIFGVSCDDSEYEGKMIAVSPQQMYESPKVVVDDWTFSYDPDSGKITFHSAKMEGLPHGTSMTVRARLLNALTGEYEDKEWVYQYQHHSGVIETPAEYGNYVMWTESRFGGFDSIVIPGESAFEFPEIALGRDERRVISFDACFGAVSAEASAEVDTSYGETSAELAVVLPGKLTGTELDPSEGGAHYDSNAMYITALRGGSSFQSGNRFEEAYQDDDGSVTSFRFIMEPVSVEWDVPQTGSYTVRNVTLYNTWLYVQQDFSGDIEIS